MSNLQRIENFVIYKTKTGKVNVEVYFQDDTLWLTQKVMAQLFNKGRSTITEHLKNIFEQGELEEYTACRDFRHTAQDGKNYTTKFYNLRAITAVGYRVNSKEATQFRKWATQVLHEYIIKGFAIDDERLKQMQHFGKDYFDEMLERIRDVRLSERRFYQKITDIYALSADYTTKAEETQKFFKVVQNKLIYAATGNTAAEIIAQRSDSSKNNMGLTSFKGTKVRKQDVTIFKNYLNKTELDTLNRVVTMYLDFAELQAKNRKQMFMKDWRQKLDAFLEFNEQEILTNAGSVSKKVADALAEKTYDKFHQNRLKAESQQLGDIDEAIKKLK